MLTIIIPSYNKDKYIKDALDSILKQKTEYDYKIIVADDCSTDDTLNIVNDYMVKYPNKIILLNSKINQKLYKNILRAYKILDTKYFCVLDPDDYWIDEYKIQKALAFLENNIEYTIYTGNTYIKDFDNDDYKGLFNNKKHAYSMNFDDFLNFKHSLGHTSSSIYRNILFTNKEFLDKIDNFSSKTYQETFREGIFLKILHLNNGYKFIYKSNNNILK